MIRLTRVPASPRLKVTLTAVMIAVLVAATARPAVAQDIPQISGIDSIVAKIQRQIGQNHRQLIENVELKLGDTMLYADEVEVFTDEDRLVARGNVTLVQTTNRISADSADFNYKTKLGTFRVAAGIATIKPPQQPPAPGGIVVPTATNLDTDVYFVGDVVEKVGPRKYKITKGGFTTCVQPTPRWQLTADTVVLNIDHYTFLRNVVFSVKGVPMLYMPVLYYPTKKDARATGILLPTIGSESLRGESIHNAFFWAINRSQDATLEHDWYSKTGQGYGGEYRYNYGANSTGYMTAFALKQHNADYAQPDGTVTTLSLGDSYQLHGEATQVFPGHIIARGRVNYFSSMQDAQSFNMNYVNAYTQARSYGGNAVGTWGSYSLNATLDHNDSFSSETASATYGSWPKISFTRSEKIIPGTPLYFSLGAEYASLLRSAQDTAAPGQNYSQDTTRLDLNPQIRYPFKKWQWFTVNTTLSWRDTYYTGSLAVDPVAATTSASAIDEPLNRRFYTMQAQFVGPVFTRVWDTPDNGYAEKFKHTIEPFFTVSRTSPIDNFNRIIQVDGTDTIYGDTTQQTYGVNNRFYAKRSTTPGARSQAVEILDVSISQSHYSNSSAAYYDPQYQTSASTASISNFSPISIAARVMPTSAINGTLNIDVDSRYLKMRQLSAGGSYAWTTRVQTNLSWSKQGYIPQLTGYNYLTGLVNTVTGGANAHTRDNHYGTIYNFTYDVTNGTILQQSISGFYNSQCCGLAFQYQTFNYAGVTAGLGIPADHRFFLSFTLAGLGNFSPFNGAMSGTPR